MNSLRIRRATIAVAAVAILPLAMTACSDDSKDSKADSSSSASKSKESQPSEASGASDLSKPFGPGCASVPKSGKGSFNGMATDPVATAASNNPALSTLVTAVKKAGLVDTLNSAKGITVFAPTNDAFAKMPKADLDKVLADKATLTKILTYHVVGETVKAPKGLADGSYTTLQKGKLTTSGSGESYMVNDSAKVVCGNVPTSNATVHLIDTVLMPK
ncbi:fasciclin domain-containing protein [Streptomyces sp. H27-D2]|uniref:fasciclin domain-containing protein n=1 Tax=Streptomyces sp. H27-D2 TaxID=3046304 RepID=UPI002DB639C5|nr:fasciclin domain-containing protein [Streptomyces sp. H27-D2]MEC4018728.1 fasciclin domain-containing protein [Streptomyces sp. H27-D2]